MNFKHKHFLKLEVIVINIYVVCLTSEYNRDRNLKSTK